MSGTRPTTKRRIDNLCEIATDETVNNFARSVCAEAARHLNEVAAEVRRLREELTRHKNALSQCRGYLDNSSFDEEGEVTMLVDELLNERNSG